MYSDIYLFICDECDKTFKKEETLEKHVQASHEEITLFCNYFNNEKDCPFEEEFISFMKNPKSASLVIEHFTKKTFWAIKV